MHFSRLIKTGTVFCLIVRWNQKWRQRGTAGTACLDRTLLIKGAAK